MNPAEIIVVLAVLIVLLVLVVRRSGADQASPRVDQDHHRLAEEVQQLKARIQVLERVITDNRSTVDLTDEIERLRDR